MPRNNQNNRGGNRRSNNNNPEGRNQYSGFSGMARERPVAAAAAAAAAVGAGVFLWSRRNQISEQLTNISDQIGEWTDNMSSSSDREFEMAGGSEFTGSTATGTSTGSTVGASRGTTTRSARPSGSGRRGASTGTSTGSGTMSGGSLDTGPSGRGNV